MAEQNRMKSSRVPMSPIWAAMRFVFSRMFSVRFLPSPSSVYDMRPRTFGRGWMCVVDISFHPLR